MRKRRNKRWLWTAMCRRTRKFDDFFELSTMYFDELLGDAKSMRIKGVTVDADTGVVGIRFRE